jgi:transcriptional regulator with XRE-family HTH domain
MSHKRRYSKVSQAVHAEASPDFAEAFDKRLADRQLIKTLLVMRARCGLSQEEIADKLNCTQSRISKLESGKDADMRIGDIMSYAEATGHDIQVVFLPKDSLPLATMVKYHFFETKKSMEKLVGLATTDEVIGKGVAGFFGEACLNFICMLVEKVKALPRRAQEHVPLVKLLSEVGEDKEDEGAHCRTKHQKIDHERNGASVIA